MKIKKVKQYTYIHKKNDVNKISMDLIKSGFLFVHIGSNYMVNQKGEIYSLYMLGIKKQQKGKRGYMRCMILDDNKRQHYVLTHRAVAIAFLGDKTDRGLQVNHKDGNKGNNNVENLEWVTPKENERHKRKRINKSGFGTTNPMCKLSESDVQEIFILNRKNVAQHKIAKTMNCVQSHISNIINKRIRVYG